MTTLTHRDNISFVNDLIGWFSDSTLHPQVKVEEYRQGDQHVVRADLPGIDPDKDVEVVVHDGLLTIRGERREEKHDHHRTEVAYGAFQRTLRLPEGVTGDEVAAAYADGVLTVTIPAPHEAQAPRTIPVTHHELPVE